MAMTKRSNVWAPKWLYMYAKDTLTIVFTPFVSDRCFAKFQDTGQKKTIKKERPSLFSRIRSRCSSLEDLACSLQFVTRLRGEIFKYLHESEWPSGLLAIQRETICDPIKSQRRDVCGHRFDCRSDGVWAVSMKRLCEWKVKKIIS